MLDTVIDLSHYETLTDAKKVKQSGIAAAIHKATEGASYVDPTFVEHRKELIDAGLLFGAYHFGVAGDPVAQADHFLETVGTNTLMALDFEPNPHGYDMQLLEAEQFVEHVFQSTGRYPGLYSGHTIKEALVANGITSPDQTILSKCWLWIAQYASSPLIPRLWDHWTFWQYTDGVKGKDPKPVSGIGRCTRDFYNGTDKDLISFWTTQSGTGRKKSKR